MLFELLLFVKDVSFVFAFVWRFLLDYLELSEKWLIFAVNLTRINFQAMAIHYDFFRNANTMDSNKERFHPRPTHSPTITNEDLMKELKELSGLSTASVTAVLHGLQQSLVRHLSDGHNVQVDGIGTFSISLSAPETRTPSATRASSIKVKAVNFRCDKSLKDEVIERATFVRDRFKTQSPELDNQLIIQKVAEYFKSNRSLNRKQFQSLTFLNASTAVRRLRMLLQMGYIANMSNDNRHPLYVATSKLMSL